jgi:hypothetical protein
LLISEIPFLSSFFNPENRGNMFMRNKIDRITGVLGFVHRPQF